MNPILVALIAGAIAITVFIYIVHIIAGNAGGKFTDSYARRRAAPAFGVVVMCGVTIFVIAISTDEISSGTVVVDSSGKIVKVYKSQTKVWSNHPHLSNKYRRFNIKEYTASIPMRLSPITSNPKVRDLRYEIKLSMSGSVKKVEQFCRSKFRCDYAKLFHFVRGLMFEFNERNSKELSVYYNPEDDHQQASFSNKVRDYLRPFLYATGATISDIRFSLP